MFRTNIFVIRLCMKCSTMPSVTPLRNYIKLLNVAPIACSIVRYGSHSNHEGDVSKSFNGTLNDDFDFKTETTYTNIDYQAITNGDEEKLKTLKILQLEVELFSQQGKEVPLHITTDQWKDLLATSNEDQRCRYLRYLWIIEIKKKHRKEEKIMKYNSLLEFKAKLAEADRKVLTTNSPIEYKLTATSIFHRIRDTTMSHFYNYKLLQAEWFGPKVIVDCSYESYMNIKNLKNCVKQFVMMWSSNRENCNPFDIVFCNVDEKGSLWQNFTQRIPLINEPDSPVHFTRENYLNIFPKENLVYLTPDSKGILEEFSHDDIYIIGKRKENFNYCGRSTSSSFSVSTMGKKTEKRKNLEIRPSHNTPSVRYRASSSVLKGGFVDTNRIQPISLAKAKRENLRTAKFPLDKYLQWAVGHKTLPLNQVISILNDLKDGLSWPSALKHVPKRKIISSSSNHRENKQKLNPRTAAGICHNYRKKFLYDAILKGLENKKK